MSEESKKTPSPKTAAQLRKEYEGLVQEVKTMAADAVKFEKKLLVEVKEKVKKNVGDFEAMKERKRQAYILLQAAERAEAANAAAPERVVAKPAKAAKPAK